MVCKCIDGINNIAIPLHGAFVRIECLDGWSEQSHWSLYSRSTSSETTCSRFDGGLFLLCFQEFIPHHGSCTLCWMKQTRCWMTVSVTWPLEFCANWRCILHVPCSGFLPGFHKQVYINMSLVSINMFLPHPLTSQCLFKDSLIDWVKNSTKPSVTIGLNVWKLYMHLLWDLLWDLYKFYLLNV